MTTDAKWTTETTYEPGHPRLRLWEQRLALHVQRLADLVESTLPGRQGDRARRRRRRTLTPWLAAPAKRDDIEGYRPRKLRWARSVANDERRLHSGAAAGALRRFHKACRREARLYCAYQRSVADSWEHLAA